MQAKYNLKDPTFYSYLNQSNCLEIEGVQEQNKIVNTSEKLIIKIKNKKHPHIFRK